MVFCDEDKILIKNIYQLKGYNARQLRTEFPDKGWTSSVNRLLKKFRDTGTVDRRQGSDKPRSVRTDENIDQVNDIFLSQEDQPELTAESVKYHGRQVFLSHLMSARKDLQLQCFKRRRAQDLTEANCTARKLLLHEEVFPLCGGLRLLYRWKGVHCGFSSERIVKIS